MLYKSAANMWKRLDNGRLLRSDDGVQLLEFALVLPFLVVLCIGIVDFTQAYTLKHNLVNAAREAARITVSNPVTSLTCTSTTPCSIQAAADAAKQYLVNAQMNVANCLNPASPSSSGTLTWTYSCSGVTLTINRSFIFTGAGSMVVPSTQVTLSYPYTWTFGSIIGMLVPGSTITLPTTLSTQFVMQNLT
ncbi:MAG: pilus assembly protein [Acidobacteria bacterium]|nr:pilus assembly protein [Acidobacteriota bacterium]